MSLEAAIEKNTAALEKQNTLLEKLLSTGAKNTAASASAEEKSSGGKSNGGKAKGEKPETEAKGDSKGGAAEITVEALDAKFRPWLAEFDKDHPETAARRTKFKELLTKLGAGKMSEITDATKLGKLDNWFETKAKTWDEGHGVGRFAADPEEGGDEGGEEEDL